MKVYVVDSSYDAQALIYKVDSEYDADVLLYKIESEYDSDKASELWYYTDDPYDEKALKIYHVDSQYGKAFF